MTNYEVLEDIQKTSIQLILAEQFYGHFFNNLIREVVDENHELKTAAICMNPSTNLLKLVVNNKWWTKDIYSSDPEEYRKAKYWTIKHEILHILFKHIFNWGNYSNKTIANIAVDLVVHQCIELGKIPAKLKPTLALIQNFPDFFTEYGEGGKDAHQTTDYYYKILTERWNETRDILNQSSSGNSSGTPQKGEGSKGDGSGNDSEDSDDSNDECGEEQGSAMSDNPNWDQLNESQKNLANFMASESNQRMHSTWKDISKLDKGMKEFTNSWIDSTIKEVADKLDRSNLNDRQKWRGTLPAGLRAYIDQLIENMTPSVNWKRYLRRFAANGEKSYLDTTIKKRSKRFNTFPGTKIRTECKVLVAIDTSGSVDNESLAEFFSEIHWIWKSKADVRIVECDTQIGKIWDYKGKFPGEITGRGGTDFNAPIEYANTEYKADAVIYFTDGYASPPIKCKCPLMWLVCKNNGVDVSEMEAFQGIKIKMDF